MTIDIITNYTCNYSCPYCFLEKVHKDTTVIDAFKLDKQLQTVSKMNTISDIHLYGGEITLLPLSQIQQLLDIASKYAPASVITNFSNPIYNSYFNRNRIPIITSLNQERSNHRYTEQSLLCSPIQNISIAQVVTPSLLKKSPKEVLSYLSLFHRGMSFLQYSPSELSSVNYFLSNLDYAFFLKNILQEYFIGEYPFIIQNVIEIEEVLNGIYNPHMTSILFINPYNQLGYLTYSNGIESFCWINDIYEWEQACRKEYEYFHKKCSGCKYLHHCYAEHLRDWDMKDECCGMYSLVEWYEKNIYQNNRKLPIKM